MLCDVTSARRGHVVEHTLQFLCSTAPPHAMHTTVISNLVLDHRGSTPGGFHNPPDADFGTSHIGISGPNPGEKIHN